MTSVGTDCGTPAEHAESATVHSLLNCYLRETHAHKVVPADRAPAETDAGRVVVVPLPKQGLDLFAPLRYESLTGRHLFALPVSMRSGGRETVPLDAATLAALLTRELALETEDGEDAATGDDLLSRVLSSKANIERFVAARAESTDSLYGFETTFREAEQSLLYGHLLHPTPKSRRGIRRREASTYAPELEGSFPLYYFRVDPSLIDQGSALDRSAAEWVREELRDDDAVSDSFVAEHVESADALLPVHPWQADYLLDDDRLRAAVDDGVVEPLGRVGRAYYPTTSVRTVYHPESSFMHKGSLAVNITNSERTHKRPELDRGVAVAELLDTELGDELRERFPTFHVVRDPAYLTVDLGDYGVTGDESGFEVVLRENPFRDETANATPVVALCQDGVDGPSRLARIVRTLAEREGRSTDAVAREWFERYLGCSLRPALWLYLRYGVGVEAHQQNSVLRLLEGYPEAFYYRDNQGYYFCESTYDEVDALCPGVGERADTLCPDSVADERVRYYLVLNNVFGVVNALGTGGVADERELLDALREELRDLRAFDRESSTLLASLLSDRRLPCKANLRTRFREMDELVGSLDEQSVYTEIPNPLVAERGASAR
ncbi:IucA/IucC family protein [Haloprofundus salinisoli]|uniref:IucA/IucC family protein n=1 Tax=Haloprofundus salinisoli TaxID=2876193 RepID=UPI001CCE7145|nr:IucA/IucC family protein [Haloprofundus salinisoli]